MRVPGVTMSQDVVHLNVGGHHFITTKATLGRYPNSMLGAMFNGSMPTTCDTEGRYFIDRDGSLFIIILNFLRSAQLALPDNFNHLEQLAIEADFYQIEPLNIAIKDYRNRLISPSPQSGRLVEVIEVRTGSTAVMPTNNSRVKTVLSGRLDVINSLPSKFVRESEKLQNKGDHDFIEVELCGSNVRLRMGEFFQSSGWELIDSNVTSSSGYDSKSMISSLIIEQTYRDRWFLPDKTT